MKSRTQLIVIVVVAILVALLVVTLRPSEGGGRSSLGEDIFYNANPPCVTCHNARRGNLSYSRMPPREMAHWISRGIDNRMPGYRLNDEQMDALIGYLMDMRRR